MSYLSFNLVDSTAIKTPSQLNGFIADLSFLLLLKNSQIRLICIAINLIVYIFHKIHVYEFFAMCIRTHFTIFTGSLYHQKVLQYERKSIAINLLVENHDFFLSCNLVVWQFVVLLVPVKQVRWSVDKQCNAQWIHCFHSPQEVCRLILTIEWYVFFTPKIWANQC